MKRITKTIFIMTFLIFSIIINGSAIKNYDVVMNINKDSTLTVTETIEYKFDSSDRGEIFWDVFLREKNNMSAAAVSTHTISAKNTICFRIPPKRYSIFGIFIPP